MVVADTKDAAKAVVVGYEDIKEMNQNFYTLRGSRCSGPRASGVAVRAVWASRAAVP